MQTPEQLLKDGNLEQAIEQQLALVKKSPADSNARFFLAELASFQGDWERADRQLEAAIVQNRSTAMLPLLLRQLVRGEIAREQVFEEGRTPEIVSELPEDCRLQLRVCMSIRTGHLDECPELLEQSDASRSSVHGTCNGADFDGFIDLDDRLRGVAEILTATGKYYWIPWNKIQSLRFSKPERPMDLIWRKTEISVDGGPEGEVYMPVRYPSPKGWTSQEQLGRATNWMERHPGVITGTGQRTLLVGEEAMGILELNEMDQQK
jgi:type VI secretion system protein ImpE